MGIRRSHLSQTGKADLMTVARMCPRCGVMGGGLGNQERMGPPVVRTGAPPRARATESPTTPSSSPRAHAAPQCFRPCPAGRLTSRSSWPMLSSPKPETVQCSAARSPVRLSQGVFDRTARLSADSHLRPVARLGVSKNARRSGNPGASSSRRTSEKWHSGGRQFDPVQLH